MMLEIALDADEEWDSSRPWAPLVRKAAEAAIAESAFPDLAMTGRPVEISVCLTSDEHVRALNAKWRGKDKPTNVLSFPAAAQPTHGGAPTPLGDVVLAYDTMLRESVEQSKPLADHLAHLLVHGTLHLLGQDHETGEAEADAMEGLEVAALRTLGVSDPYID
jgi:probable rRNA maturation factor